MEKCGRADHISRQFFAGSQSVKAAASLVTALAIIYHQISVLISQNDHIDPGKEKKLP